jgi:hypothetical protein
VQIQRIALSGGTLSTVAAAAVGASMAGCLLFGDPPASAAGPLARAARSLSLNERARLHRTSSHQLTINEQGSASGTIRGTIYIHLHVQSGHVTAEVNIYPSGGSLSGFASASYHVVGGYATFAGTMSVTRGTGNFSRAHATGLRFAGSIQRINDATTVEVSGTLYE